MQMKVKEEIKRKVRVSISRYDILGLVDKAQRDGEFLGESVANVYFMEGTVEVKFRDQSFPYELGEDEDVEISVVVETSEVRES